VFSGALTAQQFFAFSALALLITLLPGPDTALVIRAALVGGRRAAIRAAVGICTGLLVWGGLTAAGLTAFLTRFPKAYHSIAFLGGLYLLYLGWQSWRSTRVYEGQVAQKLGGSPYMSGLLTNLLNPKIAIFYLSVLPHFAPPGPFLFARSLTLAMVHVIFGMFWFSIVGVMVERSLLSPRALRWRTALQRLTALLLVTLGLRILLGW
jgi:threonine/homoserine/homoserine lactone efflux protein